EGCVIGFLCWGYKGLLEVIMKLCKRQGKAGSEDIITFKCFKDEIEFGLIIITRSYTRRDVCPNIIKVLQNYGWYRKAQIEIPDKAIPKLDIMGEGEAISDTIFSFQRGYHV
ncbi:321_t:CDS:2, partial [Diversispora eburnea]